MTLANARLVLPDRVTLGRLTVAGGRIAELTEDGTVPPGAIDLQGDLLMPGLIELHTDNLERHIEPRPKVDWPHGPAILAHDAELAGAGITTVFDALRVGMLTSQKLDRETSYARQVASEIGALRNADALRISHRIHLRAEICSETLLQELSDFGDGDGIGLVSLMDHTPGARQFRDITKLWDYYHNKLGMSEDAFADYIAEMGALRARVADRHEAGVVAFAHGVGAVLASHDDTTAAHVATSAAHGVRLAEFPTTREAAEATHAAGIAIMMGAPNLIRGGSHSGNVAAAELAEAGLLDIISSDYVPAALLSSVFVLERLWGDLPRAVATVTHAPAQATGLTDRGRLAEGLRGDLLRVARIGGNTVPRGTWVAGHRVA